MNSTNITAITAEIIQETYESHVFNLFLISATALSLYTTLITFSQEKEHIWSRPFTLPTLLYIFARYGNLLAQGFVFSHAFIPLGRLCNILGDVLNVLPVLTYIGIQGLLTVRAYSICKGNKILGSALACGFFSNLGLSLYEIGGFPECVLSISKKGETLNSINDIVIVGTNLLISGICIWGVWGIWRFKRNHETQSHNLVSILLRQSIFRIFFVITITAVGVPVLLLRGFFVGGSYARLQNALSATLIADFTLDLRRLNSAKIEASQMSLPSLRLSNVLQHVHQSLIVEMDTPEEGNMENLENLHDGDSNPGDSPLASDATQPTSTGTGA